MRSQVTQVQCRFLSMADSSLLNRCQMSLWWDSDDVPHCWILSSDKTEWQLMSATLCGWRYCFVADQLWFM